MPVALVNMPFSPATRPSIQLGILRAILERAEIPAREHYASIAFYDRLREFGALSKYTAESPSMVSEWYFSLRPFDPSRDGPDAYAVARLEAYARSIGFPFEKMWRIRTEIVPAFLDDLAREVAADSPRIVGFTMSYAQINASFALAARLKQLLPDVVTVFGGAGSQVFEDACRAYMGAFSTIDYMVLGEAELVLADLVNRVQSGESVEDLPNVMLRRGGEVVRSSGKVAQPLDLDTVPTPRYDAYFDVRARMPMATRRDLDPTLLMELGRGCTWGDELTCKFCAFIFHGKYRGKSRERVIEEARELAARHRRKSFYFVDDIVTNRQITDVLPAMADAVRGMLVTFLEMRTATTRRHVKTLADCGVTLVQPGTENFDDGLLRRISKGTTAFHNVQFLKWAKELGVRVSHNVLLNVPCSTADEVRTQLDGVRKLKHLDPPFSFPVQIVRYSPYHADPEGHGLNTLHPDPFYRWLFPDAVDAAKVAYEFVEEGAHDDNAALHEETSRAVTAWQMRWGRLPLPFLVYDTDGDDLIVQDGREIGAPLIRRYGAPAARVHGCITDCPMNVEGILRAHPDLDAARVQAILDDMTAHDVALQLRGRWLSLAVDAASVRRWQPIPQLDVVAV